MSADALREQIRAQVRTALSGSKAVGADTSVASVTALMQRFEAGYANVNAEAIVACFAPDVVWTLPDSRVLRGRAACLAFLKERFASPAGPQFSDSHLNVLGQTVVIRPLPISKLNTVIQIVMVAVTLLTAGLQMHWPILDAILVWTVAASTLASLAAYLWTTGRGSTGWAR